MLSCCTGEFGIAFVRIPVATVLSLARRPVPTRRNSLHCLLLWSKIYYQPCGTALNFSWLQWTCRALH